MLKTFKLFVDILKILDKKYNGWSHSVLDIAAAVMTNCLSGYSVVNIDDYTGGEQNLYNALYHSLSFVPSEAHMKMRKIIQTIER
jgi:hypothetical protein